MTSRSRRTTAGLLALAAVFWATPAIRAAVYPLTAGQDVPGDIVPGPFLLSLRPSFDRDRGQPLLGTGGPGSGSLLFWLWDSDDRARIGFEDAQQGVSFSSSFPASPNETHRLEIAWGALWPEWAGPSDGLSAAWRDTLFVSVDGHRVLCRKQAFGLRTRHLVFGANVIGSAAAAAYFNGALATVEPGEPGLVQKAGMRLVDQLPQQVLPRGAYAGPLRLSLSFPPGVPGRSEPLLVGGKPGAAGFFYVHYDDSAHLRLGFDSWAWQGPVSQPIAYRPRVVYHVTVSVGFLFPPADPPQADATPVALLPSVVWAEWEDRPVLATIGVGPSVPPEQVVLGVNLIGWNLTEPAFRGLFSGVERIDPARIAVAAHAAVFPSVPTPGVAWIGYPGAIRLLVAFPKLWRPGAAEPLVVAGPTGAADILYVAYEEEGRVHFGLDHWGGASLVSGSVAVAPGSEHVLTIAMGALFPPEGAPLYVGQPNLAAERGQVRLELDGRAILRGARPAFHVPPAQITYGVNLAGGSMSGPAFTGQILEIKAVSSPATTGPDPAGLQR